MDTATYLGVEINRDLNKMNYYITIVGAPSQLYPCRASPAGPKSAPKGEEDPGEKEAPKEE
jgi:hypothetical protein